MSTRKKTSARGAYTFLFIHGYTGSVSDFRDLPRVLKKRFRARVSCPLLPGHGTKASDLHGMSHDALYRGVEKDLSKEIEAGRRVILVGMSMGAQEALYLATKYPVAGVVAIATTHLLRFPLNLSVVGLLGFFKARWKKRLNPVESGFRTDNRDVYYDEMPSDGWYISQRLRAQVQKCVSTIAMPVLFIHSQKEKLADPNGVVELAQQMGKGATVRLIPNESHNMLYSSAGWRASTHITEFVDGLGKKRVQNNVLERVSVVIPAYNEGSRVGAVLRVLLKSRFVGEVIVVDDGSTDDTSAVVRRFPQVTLIRHTVNRGKGASMDEGVRRASNDVIFFCDADLLGFTTADAEDIMTPVLDGTHDMFIGMRGNFMQRAVHAWGLNSGERALRKSTWNSLPSYYKYRYRIEAGLNRHVKAFGTTGLGWRHFTYTQPIKESKYGLLRGTWLRWWMNIDVISAYLAYPLIGWWRHKYSLWLFKS